ncbi:MAG: hypothetical protein IJ243_10000, partial [Prevotella sp.]|nr:hypothetical protein [Prevotella sp.]
CTFVHDFVSFVVWSLQNYKILGEWLRSGPLFLWNLYYFALLSDSNSLAPSTNLPILSHEELHQKREEVVRDYYRQIEAKEEQKGKENLLKDILSEITIPSEEEIAKEAERISQQ